MKLLTRAVATCTVLGGFVAAPILSRLSAPNTVLPSEAVRAESSGSFPRDWSIKVVNLLKQRPLSIDDAGVDAIVCHAETAARRFGLDPFTVLALIDVESGFDPFAVSSAEAKGLMQLRGDTAREVAGRLGVAFEAEDLLFDPETNILLGTAYFRELLDKFGEMDVALAAFHAGPARFSVTDPRLGPVSIEYTSRIWAAIERFYRTAERESFNRA